MRWLVYPIALTAGLGLVFAIGASASPACPSDYHPTTRHRVLLCLRTVTRTTTTTQVVGQASGSCLYTFGIPGVYEVSVAAGSATPITTDVQIG